MLTGPPDEHDPSALGGPPSGGNLIDWLVDQQTVAPPAPTANEPPKDQAPTAYRPAADPQALHARFLEEANPLRALLLWAWQYPTVPRSAAQLCRRISRDIARLDALLSDQVNRILHHPAFQQLEASWRGLRYLVETVPESEAGIKVRLLNISWRELTRDLERASEFDQSQLFQKIYSDEFGMPGGEPYGLLLGDYDVCPFPSAKRPLDDVGTLRQLAAVAAASFAPMILAANPAMFGLDDFSGLEQPLDFRQTFSQAEYTKWNGLRDSDDVRFLGLMLPRVLMRRPYADDGSRSDGFRFAEDVRGRDASKFLWGNAVYAFGAVVLRSFANYGWVADLRGARDEEDGAGRVGGLTFDWFATDRAGIALKSPTDVMVSDRQEQELSELGFIPLCYSKDTTDCVLYSASSIQRFKTYDQELATTNSRLSAMLHYMLCVSRFAHYVKVLGRDKVGGFKTADDCQRFLNRWLLQYVLTDDTAGPETRARHPLREASVQVRESVGKPGGFDCTIHLRPHFQLEQLSTAIKLTTELTRPRGT
jgi:type VI secretion system ImpC/EvpB family protein